MDRSEGGNAAVSKVIFEINVSGTITNYTRYTSPAVGNDTSGVYTINFTQPQFSGAGEYRYRWFANDTGNEFNLTNVVIFTITQNRTLSFMNLTLNGTEANLAVTYRSVHNATANSSTVTDANLPFNFTRNITHLFSNIFDGQINSVQLDLPVGEYNYTFNTSGNANYSAGTKSFIHTVQNATSNVTLTMTPGVTTYPTSTTTVCTADNRETSANLYRNASLANTENNTAIILGAGQWAYTCNVTATQNFTFAGVTNILNISKGDALLNLTLNGTQANRNYTRNEVANFTAYSNVSFVREVQQLILTSNYTGWVDLTSIQYIFNTTNLTTVGQNWNITTYFVGNSNLSYTTRSVFFNVSTPPPNQPPQYKDNTTNFGLVTTFSPNKNYGFQINWTDPENGNAGVSQAFFETNVSGTITNYTRFSSPAVTNTSANGLYIINFTQEQFLQTGEYRFRWFANETGNEVNETSLVIFTINKNSTFDFMNLTLNNTEASLSVTYRSVHNATANNSIGQQILAFNFTRNLTHLANNLGANSRASEQLDLAVGQYNYTYNTSGNINYTASTKSFVLTVSNATSNATLTVTPTAPVTYAVSSTAICTSDHKESSTNLYRNDTLANTENNTGLFLPAGQWKYICNVTATQNYTFATALTIYNISRGDVNVTLQLNGTQGNRNYTQREVANFTAYTNVSLVREVQKLILTSNYTGWIDLTSDQYVFNTTNLTTIGQNFNMSGYFVGNSNLSYRQQFYLFNVSTPPPNRPPQFKENITNFGLASTYSPGKNYGFQINWTDPEFGNAGIDKVIFETNVSGVITNYSRYDSPAVTNTSNNGLYTINFTQEQFPQAGEYRIRWFANDSNAGENAFNLTSLVIFTINKNTSFDRMNLTLNKTEAPLSVTYRSVTNATGNHSIFLTGQVLSLNMTRNTTHFDGSVISGFYDEQLDLAVSQYNYTFNTSGNVNYTAGTKSFILTVGNATSNVTLTVTPAPTTYPTQSTATCTGDSREVSSNLYRNDTLANTENNTALILPVGQWKYICNITATQNFTSTTFTRIQNITKGDLTISLFLNDTQANRNYTRNEVANFTAAGNVSGITITLASNYTGWIDLTGTQFIYNTTNLTTLGQNWNISSYFNGNANLSYFMRTLAFNVTTPPPNRPPQFKENTTNFGLSTAYSTGKNYGFQINFSDTETGNAGVDKVLFETNASGTVTNYSVFSSPAVTNTSTSGLFTINFTQERFLSSGEYRIRWFANDTGNEANLTSVVIFTVTKNSSINYMNLTLNGTEATLSVTYRSVTNATGYNAISSGQIIPFNLTRNTTHIGITNPISNVLDLAVAQYNYTYNTSGNANYTTSTKSFILSVTNATSNVTLSVTPATPTFGTSTTATCTSDSRETSSNLYRNSSLANTENNTALILPGGQWTYVCNVTATQNFTFATTAQIYNVSKASNPVNLFLNGTLNSNKSYIYPQAINATAAITGGTATLFRDDASVSNPHLIQPAAKSAGYAYKANGTGNQNYSDNFTGVTFYAIVDKSFTLTSLFLNGTEGNVNYILNGIANLTTSVNTTGQIQLWTNFTGSMQNVSNSPGTSPLINYTNLTTRGAYNITGYFAGNENFSTSSQFYIAKAIGGYAEADLIEPTGIKLVKEKDTFFLNTQFTCRVATCGLLNITPRQELNVITNNTADGLYLDSGETSVKQCTLSIGQGCFANWTIVANTIGSYDVDANVSGADITNDTADVLVSVYRVVTEVVTVPGFGGGLLIIREKGRPLLDLEIVNLTPRVFTGENLIYTINLTNVGNLTTFDVVIHKSVIKDDKVLLTDAITRSMYDNISITDSMHIPDDFNVDRYFFQLFVEYVGRNASAVATFDVIKDCLTLKGVSYDLFSRKQVMHSETLKDVNLTFENICGFDLNDVIMNIDGLKIRVGKVAGSFERSINFDKFGAHPISLTYKEGESKVDFALEPPGPDLLTILLILITLGLIIGIVYYSKRIYAILQELGIVIPKISLNIPKITWRPRIPKIPALPKIIIKIPEIPRLPEKPKELKPESEVFKEELKAKVIEKLEKKFEEEENEKGRS